MLRQLLAALCIAALGSFALADDPKGIDFFEKKIRPVLAEHCYECHSAAASKAKGGLKLDSRADHRDKVVAPHVGQAASLPESWQTDNASSYGERRTGAMKNLNVPFDLSTLPAGIAAAARDMDEKPTPSRWRGFFVLRLDIFRT